MGFNVFVDANFLLDFLLNRKGYDVAMQLLLLAKKKELTAFTNPSIIQTVSFYIQKDFDPSTAKSILLELLKLINIVETSMEVILEALNSSINDIEDAVHYHTAIAHRMDYLITSDIKFTKLNGTALNIKTPADFLQKLQT